MAERADLTPALQVGRGVEYHPMLTRTHHHHHPAPGGRVPQHLGIAERCRVGVEHRVARIGGEGAAAIDAGRDLLCLLRVGRARIDRDQPAAAVGKQPASVVAVVHRRAAERLACRRFAERDRQLAPAHQVGADRVSPMNVAGLRLERIVLVEQMVLALMEDQAVGIIHEPLCRRVMDLRPVASRPSRTLRRREGGSEHGRNAEPAQRAPRQPAHGKLFITHRRSS